MSLDENLPIANWPEKDGEYKVVQLDIHGKPHLRFAQRSYETHGIILKLLLGIRDDKDLTFVGASGTRSPEPEGEGYKVRGMGRAKVNVEQRTASFYGSSDDYGFRIDKTHLDSIRTSVPDWKISRVED